MTQRAQSRFLNIIVLSASRRRDLPSGLAAYIDRALRVSATTGEAFNFTGVPTKRAKTMPPAELDRIRAEKLVHSEVMLPEGVDDSFKDVGTLWARMERAEMRKTPRRTGPRKQTKAQLADLLARIEASAPKHIIRRDELAYAWRDDAQLAYHFILALPWPFTTEQHIAAVRTFIERELLPHGFICQIAIHPPDENSPLNWHAHILVATRPVDGLEIGDKIRGVLAEFGNTAGGSGVISPDGRWPDRWAAIQEDIARAAGVNLKIAPKAAISEQHLGTIGHVEGGSPELTRAEAKAEAKRVIRLPGVLPEVLTEIQATFTEDEAREALEHHAIPAEEALEALEDLHTFPEVLPLFDRETGRFIGRFTTTAVRRQEQRIRELAAALHAKPAVSPLQSRLAAAASKLIGELRGRPVAELLAAATVPCSIVLVEPPAQAEPNLLRALVKLRNTAQLKFLGIAPTPGAARALRRAGLPAGTLATELRLQADDKAEAWNADKVLVVCDADLYDTHACEQFLSKASEAGAKVIFIGRDQPRHSIGRGGAYAILQETLRTAPTSTLAVTASTERSRSSIAFAAAVDLPAPTIQQLDQSRTTKPAARPPQLRAPQPWRRPGASLSEIWNLACDADCDEIGRQIQALPPEEAAERYRTLPPMSVPPGADRPPLANLHINLKAWFYRLGIDPRTGKVDVDSLKVPLNNLSSFKDRRHLAPRNGHPDVRRLLAPIDSLNRADWRAITERMSGHPADVLQVYLNALGDLSQRSRGETETHAIAFARLQVYRIAKDGKRDFLPDLSPDDLWSIIPAGERIRAAIKAHGFDEVLVPMEASARAPASQSQQETPIWLTRPSWSPLGCWGVDPLGDKRGHYQGLHDATPEQRAEYCDGLLQIYAQSPSKAMRAWSAQGLQHLANWHRRFGEEHVPIALNITARAAGNVYKDWSAEPGYKGDPFRAEHELRILKHLSRCLLSVSKPADLRKVADQIAELPRRRDGDPRVVELIGVLRRPVDYLRRRSTEQIDPTTLNPMLGDLAQAIGEPLPSMRHPRSTELRSRRPSHRIDRCTTVST